MASEMVGSRSPSGLRIRTSPVPRRSPNITRAATGFGGSNSAAPGGPRRLDFDAADGPSSPHGRGPDPAPAVASPARPPAPRPPAPPQTPQSLAAALVARDASAVPRLRDLPQWPIVDSTTGRVAPPGRRGAVATAFVVYDASGTAMFIGFSQDLRNSLRRVLVRQPEDAVTFSCLDFPTSDEAELLAARRLWFAELGSIPPGNTASGFPAWGEAITVASLDVGYISARVADIRARLGARGLREHLAFELSADTLQLDVLATTAESGAEVMGVAAAVAAAEAAACRDVDVLESGMAEARSPRAEAAARAAGAVAAAVALGVSAAAGIGAGEMAGVDMDTAGVGGQSSLGVSSQGHAHVSNHGLESLAQSVPAPHLSRSGPEATIAPVVIAAAAAITPGAVPTTVAETGSGGVAAAARVARGIRLARVARTTRPVLVWAAARARLTRLLPSLMAHTPAPMGPRAYAAEAGRLFVTPGPRACRTLALFLLRWAMDGAPGRLMRWAHAVAAATALAAVGGVAAALFPRRMAAVAPAESLVQQSVMTHPSVVTPSPGGSLAGAASVGVSAALGRHAAAVTASRGAIAAWGEQLAAAEPRGEWFARAAGNAFAVA